jgi:hypothetical protein
MQTARANKSWWALIGVVLGAGWAVYGILGGGKVFLAVMVAASMILGAGGAVFLRQSSD